MKKIFIVFLFCLVSTSLFSQVNQTNFADSFNRATLSPGGTPSATYTSTSIGSTTVGTNGNATLQEVVSALQVLVPVTTTAAPYATMPLSTYSAPFNTVLSSNTGLLTWTFNMQTSAAATGFTGTHQEVAVVLAGTSSALSSAGSGYAVAFTTGTNKGVQLVKYNNGLQSTATPVTTIITPTTNMMTAATDYVSVEVTYDPSTNKWSLYMRDDGSTAFAYPTGVTTQVGSTTVDNTYTSSTMSVSGFYCNYSVTASGLISYLANTATFDNFTSTGPCNPPKITSVTPSSTSLCAGTQLSLKDSVTGAVTYSWAGPNSYSSTMKTPAAFNVYTVSAGVYSFTATSLIGCVSTATTTAVAVYNAPFTITGTPSVCASFSNTLSDAATGGTWSSSAPTVATVNATTGSVTGIMAGSSTITYAIAGCTTYATQTYTVSTQPAAITGTASACAGATSTLSDATASGTWSSSNLSIASVNTTGTVSAVATGSATISYTLGGCNSTIAYTTNVQPAAITGTNTVCAGSGSTLNDVTPSGTWISGSPGTASINSSSGAATGIAVGSATITYAIGTCKSTTSYTVNTQPAVITGTNAVCAGATSTLSDVSDGGTWSSGNTAIASVNTTGAVNGIAAGSANISYTIGSCSSVTSYTVNTQPVAITGTASSCANASSTLSDATASGNWSSSNASIATVNITSGSVTGIATGSATITYAIGSCIATTPYTVNTQPAAITGTTAACAGSASTLSDATGSGSWSSSNTSTASINSGGNVAAITAGSATITYTLGSCISTTTYTVNTQPVNIAGTAAACAGSTSTLTDATGGGNWSSSNTSIASVNTTGTVTGIATGSATITYGIGSCTVTTPYTVNTQPAAITGTAATCAAGGTSALSDATGSGSWSSSNTSIASVNTTGTVTGIATGSATIIYTIGSCSSTKAYTVNTQPGSITGTTGTCTGSATTLSDAPGSGNWSSSNTAIATVNTTSGSVTGISAGTATITYSAGSCIATTPYTVNTTPGAVTGSSPLCPGSTATYSDALTGGAWSSSNATIASVNAGTGLVTAVASGTTIISYTLMNLCGTHSVTNNITVSTYGQWIGGTSTDWTDVTNWICGTVPIISTDVYIPIGTTYQPTIGTGNTITIDSLSLSAGTTLTLSGTAICNVTANLSNNGQVSGPGTIVLEGSHSAQNISGTGIINNLTVNNSSGVTIVSNDSVKITGTLTPASGTITTNGGLVLQSDSTGTGRIGTITGGAITGNVIVQQYIAGGRRAYRFWAHPFSSYIPLSQISSYIDITGSGGAANGFTPTSTNASSCYWYNTVYGNDTLSYDPGWRAFTNTSATIDSNRFEPYEGIRLFMRGKKSEGLDGLPYTPSATTISIYGQVNTGNITMPLHSGATSNYNLVGNPYPSPTDIGTVIYNAEIAGKVTGAAFYVWNPYLGTSGAYQTIPISGSSYYIEANASFEVQATSDSSSLSFTENNKSATSNATLLRTTSPDYITLEIGDSAGTSWDMLYIKFNQDASDNQDADYDAGKLLNPDLNFYSLTPNNLRLGIDSRPYGNDKVIPLGITSNYKQSFIMKVNNPNSQSEPLYLHDRLLHTYTLLGDGTTYPFTITNDSATQGNKRFELRTDTITTSRFISNEISMHMTPNPAKEEVTVDYQVNNSDKADITVVNTMGQVVYTQKLGNAGSGSVTLPLDNISAGVYVVTLNNGDKKTVQKLVKE